MRFMRSGVTNEACDFLVCFTGWPNRWIILLLRVVVDPAVAEVVELLPMSDAVGNPLKSTETVKLFFAYIHPAGPHAGAENHLQ